MFEGGCDNWRVEGDCTCKFEDDCDNCNADDDCGKCMVDDDCCNCKVLDACGNCKVEDDCDKCNVEVLSNCASGLYIKTEAVEGADCATTLQDEPECNTWPEDDTAEGACCIIGCSGNSFIKVLKMIWSISF